MVLPALAACAQQPLASTGSELSLTERNRAVITEYSRLRGVGSSHDVMEAFNAPGRVEHNAEIADGLDGDRGYLETRRQAAPEKYDPVDKYVNVLHNILADGDLVAIKSHLFVSAHDAGRVFVDIWRIEDGRFAEHWDVIQPVGPEPGALDLSACGIGTTYQAAKALKGSASGPACGAPDPESDREANRELVLDYMKLSVKPDGLAKVVDTYIAPDFFQHSANIPPGRQGLLEHLRGEAAAQQADNCIQHFRRVLADGDLVMVHRWETCDSNPRGTARLDLFRVKGGKISEHWDVVQPVPPFSVAGHSMTGGPDTPLEPARHKGPIEK